MWSSVLLGLAVFITAFLVDVAWARAVTEVSAGRRGSAVLWSTLLYLLSMMGVLGLVADPLVAITAGCLGSAAGTYVGVGNGPPTSPRTEHVPRAIRFLDQNTPTTDAPAAVIETPAVSKSTELSHFGWSWNRERSGWDTPSGFVSYESWVARQTHGAK